jgi:hypothetical protein
MKRLVGSAIAAGTALAIGALVTATAQAMPASQLSPNAVNLNSIEKTQLFIFGGRHYCFYIDGWHGPGWYWCGYRWRHGFGWGGPEGWRGWYRGGRRGGYYRGGHIGGHMGYVGGHMGGHVGGHMGPMGGHGPGGHMGGHGPGGGGHGPGGGGHGGHH